MLAKQSEWEVFYASMLKRTGLDLYLYRPNQLQRRILSLAENKGFKNLAEFWRFLAQQQENIDWFCDHLAINVSELFRNPDKWREMETKIIPTLLEKNSRLKVWSAGCSYGAEAYTLAMILDKKFTGGHRIIGSDIDLAALRQAGRGEFTRNDTRAVPQEYKEYLHETNGAFFADEKLRKYLSFKKQNLLADRFESGFDMIMCRNVVIYFTEEAKNELYKKFFDALKPGGILFIGSTERIPNPEDIGLETAMPFFYQKPMLRNNTWRNAS